MELYIIIIIYTSYINDIQYNVNENIRYNTRYWWNKLFRFSVRIDCVIRINGIYTTLECYLNVEL